MPKYLLETHELLCGYGGKARTPILNLKIPVGEVVGLLGPNGSGKSTLLQTLLGILPPVSGNYAWEDSVTFGYVPQCGDIDSLIPFSLQDIIRMGERPRWWQGLDFRVPAKFSEILRWLDMRGSENHLFRELSVGQKQRALLGRALMSFPNTLILDEPFSSLDYRFRQQMWGQLSRWRERHSGTLIWIDHEMNHVVNHATYLILLGRGQVYSGPTQDLLTEAVFQKTYEVSLHIHKENGLHQIHFL